MFCSQDAALAPEFMAAAEYSTSPGADLEGLLQRLETAGTAGVSPFPHARQLEGSGEQPGQWEHMDLSGTATELRSNIF